MVEVGHPHLMLWGEGRLDFSGRSEDHGSRDAGLPANHGTGHCEELPALYAGYFGAWFKGPTGPQ
jgi:hypothetical protein